MHSRYERTLADAAVAGRPISLRLRVRRFICPAADCPAGTFVEQIDGLTTRHAPRTPQLRGMLEAIALALAGRAGARVATKLGLEVFGVERSRAPGSLDVRSLARPGPPPPNTLTVGRGDGFLDELAGAVGRAPTMTTILRVTLAALAAVFAFVILTVPASGSPGPALAPTGASR